ncbi:polysaccharide biosynthesis/export family protein [Candidatus Cyanaurora vandensis]|uniref:polysaccharide biosynthesis/export family protein n=1 Tax=Candidatus Cyanaurora vandensis TaxID=2714958 RepID=UPI00257A05D3|nr:polysaccharide biosynthesis/export family protein [Candidatus Cyanaurora vandensis]
MKYIWATALVLMMAPSAWAADPVATPVPNFTVGVAAQGYRLRSGDSIRVEVFDFPELSKDQVILPDGTINIMHLGAVQAAGISPSQLSDELAQRFKGYLRNPVVAVSVTDTRPLRVNVIGEVLRPGPQDFASVSGQSENNSNSNRSRNTGVETLSRALSLAGGVTPAADLRKVVVVRPTADGLQEYPVDLWNALQTGDFREDITLSDGDTVRVAALTPGDALSEKMAQDVAVSTLAPRTVQVQVAGEVKNAGLVNADPRSSVLNAISLAGGPTQEADLGNVNVARMAPNGRVERFTVNLQAFTEGKTNYQVRNGDVIFVGRDGFHQTADMIGTILGPIGQLFQTIFFGGRTF